MEEEPSAIQELEGKLAKIREPGLQSQQQTRVVLVAVEDTLREQQSPFTPTAYFAALLALLGQNASEQLVASVVYLLDLTTPFVPTPILRSKSYTIVSSLLSTINSNNTDASLVRATIGTLVSLLVVQDAQAWTPPATQAGSRQALATLLRLCADTRPKVRKRAQDAVARVLAKPPPGPSSEHPAAVMCAEAALNSFEVLATEYDTKRRQSKADQGHDPGLIHSMQLIKTVGKSVAGWPSKGFDALTSLLLGIARSRNEYLTSTAFEVFETVFEGMVKSEDLDKLNGLLDAVIDVQPSQKDSQLLPPWIAIISRGYDILSQIDEIDTFQKLPAIFEKISTLLASSSRNVCISAAECLKSFLVNCVPASIVLEPSILDEKVFEKLAQIMNSLFEVKYQSAWIEVFQTLSSMLENFRWHSVPVLEKAVQTVGELRASDAVQNKAEADSVLASAIRYMGPAAVLRILPLNLGSTDSKKQGRAWLVPIIRDNVSNTELLHFKNELMPLSEKLFQKVAEAKEPKTVETKVYETLLMQIWSCLPGYCDRPTDVKLSFDQDIAELISKLLYQQTQMRNDICHALQNLVEGFKLILAQDQDEQDLVGHNRLSMADAQASLDHLSLFAANSLAVLFNVYGETLPQHRTPILNAINSYLSITPASALTEMFERVASTFETAFTEQTAKAGVSKEKKGSAQALPPVTHALMDIVITMSIYLPRDSYQRLSAIAVSMTSQRHESALQKKAYKLIPRLTQSVSGREAIVERNGELQKLFLSNTENTLVQTRKDRLAALTSIVKSLPDSDLAFVANITPEAILCTKETNERARENAYTLIVVMGERMAAGGTVDNSRVVNAPPDAQPVPATVGEYFTILSAGLAGSTPHMISASITAISRALFEFHKDVPQDILSELLETMSLFLESPTREVVRSVLGFVKIYIINLPTEVVEPRLPQLIPRLIRWSHEHKGDFRTKVKNILERIIRRFGVQIVERNCPEEDRKLVTHIRKTREQRKKKKHTKVTDAMDIDQDEEGESKAKFSNAFDQAVYGSDESESDEDTQPQGKQRGKVPDGKGQRKKQGNAYIQEDEDEPLDLLDKRALGNISTTRPAKAPTINKRFISSNKKDEDGRLIIKEGENFSDDDEDEVNLDQAAEGGSLEKGINAYVEAIRGKNAPQRGQRGRLKFKNKSRGADEMDVDDEKGVNSGRGEIKSPRGQHRRLSSGDKTRGGRVAKRGMRGRGGFRGRR